MAVSLDATTCALRQRVRSGLTEGPCDLEPHHSRGPVGRGLRFYLPSAGLGSQDVEASPGPTGLDGSHVLGLQASKGKALG